MSTEQRLDPQPATPLLDLSGLACPHVVLRLADHMRGLVVGDRVALVSTDRLSPIDVRFYLDRVGHRLVEETRHPDRIVFLIEAGVARPPRRRRRDA